MLSGSHAKLASAGAGLSTEAMLIATHAAIIWWVNVTLAPVEVVYDAIESELERREAAAESAPRIAPG